MAERLKIKTIKQGIQSGFKGEADFVVRSQGELDGLWDCVHSYMGSVPNAPEINFDSEMLIGVFRGNQPSTGYRISITDIVGNGDSLSVTVRKTSPKPGMLYSSTVVQPYHLVRVPKVRDVKFIRQ